MLGTALSDMKNAAPTGIGSGAIFNGSLRGDSEMKSYAKSGTFYTTKVDVARRFSEAVREFARATGNVPPSAVYEAHPAAEALTDLIQARVGRPWPRCAKGFWRRWAAAEARQILRDLVDVDGELTDAGISAEELREDHTQALAWRAEVRAFERDQRRTVSWPADTPGLRVCLIRADLIDRRAPDDPATLAVWHAVRECPAPPMTLMRDDAPTWSPG